LLTFLSRSATFAGMQVVVNGDAVQVPDGCTVASLLEHIKVEAARVAVERNHDVVPRRSWAECALADGDRVEIVAFVGGG
jgi:sulfur carrier protein